MPPDMTKYKYMNQTTFSYYFLYSSTVSRYKYPSNRSGCAPSTPPANPRTPLSSSSLKHTSKLAQFCSGYLPCFVP